MKGNVGKKDLLLPGGVTGDLPEEQVPGLGSGGAAVGEGEGDGVGGGGAEFGVHVVASHGATHCRRLLSCLASSGKLVRTHTVCLCKTRHGLEVNPERANV